MRSPAPVVSSRKRLRTILQFSTKCCMHREEALFEMPIIVDEILDPKLNAIAISEDGTNPLRHPLSCRGSKHFRIAAKLNWIVRFGGERQLRVPDPVFLRSVED